MEVSFPRGGTKRVREKAFEKDDLFNIDNANSSKKQKRQKSEKKKKETDEKDEIPIVIEQLSVQTLTVGMVILGCIQEVHDYSVTFALPGGVQGKVPITNISDSYTKLLRAFADDPDSVTETVVSPPTMFVRGFCFPVKVVETGSGRKTLLSLNPRDVNESLKSSTLYHEMTILAAVESIEDHGYIMDVGIPDLKGFLSNAGVSAFVQKWNEGRPLAFGQTLLCKINMPQLGDGQLNQRTIALVAKHKTSQMLVSSDQKVNLHNLLPGVALKGEIREVRKNGLVVDCLEFGGCVWKDHLRDPWDSPYQYDVGQEVECAVLYQSPITHTLHLSLLPRPTPKNVQKRFGNLKEGDLIEEATVMSVEVNCAYLKLPGNVKALAVRSQISDLRDVVVSEFLKIGEVCICRILHLGNFEMMARVSLKRSVIHQHIIAVDDIKIGAKFSGIVVALMAKGMIVRLAKGVQGFVRDVHMGDVPTSDLSKRFPVGKKIQCQVLRVDYMKDTVTPLLTCKNILMKSTLNPLAEYSDATPNRLADGVVVKITTKGLVVTFYGDVQGWVPIGQASYEPLERPDESFYVGQVVKCRVLSCVPEERRLLLSLKVDVSRKKGLRFGDIFEAKVTKKTPDGLNVKVQPKGPYAFLPTNHLSDHPKLCKILLTIYSEGDVIEGLLCFSTRGIIIVSKKASLIQWANRSLLEMKLENLEKGMILRGVVKGFATYGIFVEIGNGVSGLAHIKTLSEASLSNVNDAGYVTHSSIEVKVLKVDVEKNRLSLSAKPKDVYDGNADDPLDLLESFLSDWKDVVGFRERSNDAKRRAITKFKVGTIVSSVVTSVTDEGVLCDLGERVKGFAVNNHLGGFECLCGETYDALVLHVDVVNDCVELAMSLQIIKKTKESHLRKVGHIDYATVMLLRDHFVLALMHEAGSLCYLPVKKHTNDMIGFTYGIGEEVFVRVARIMEGQILAVVVSEDEKEALQKATGTKRGKTSDAAKERRISVDEQADGDDSKETTKQNPRESPRETETRRISTSEGDESAEGESFSKDDVKESVGEDVNTKYEIGDTLTAVITAVKKFQLNILVDGKVKGRVHVTAIGDFVSEGDNPLQKFGVGQEIEVRVIGYRRMKSHRFLVVSHRWTRDIPEFCLQEKFIRPEEIAEGLELMGFVREFSRSCLWVWLTAQKVGRINLLNLSSNPNVLRRVEEKFLPGQAVKVRVLSASPNAPIELTKIRETKIETGRIVLGMVLAARRDLGVFVRLSGGYRGTIGLADLRDSFRPASIIMEEMIRTRFVRCCVLEVDENSRTCRLSTRSSRFRRVPSSDDPEINDLDSIEKGTVLRGFLTSYKIGFPNVTLGYNVRGTLEHSSLPENVQSNLREHMPLGTVLRVQVESVENKRGPVLMLLDYDVDGRADADASLEMKIEPGKKKRRLSSSSSESQSKKLKTLDVPYEKHPLESSAPESAVLPHLDVKTEFLWDVDATPNLNSLVNAKNDAPSSSDSEYDEKSDGMQGKKKSRKEKMEEAREEEQKLFREERRLTESDWQPETVDDFDRTVATSPNNSLVWLKYMAFHLQQAEVEKARAVAERALKTICFRDEQEKLNVWVAMLNLENLYGTGESLNDVFQRALQQNEPIKVYTHMVNIYDRSEKVKEAEEMYSTMIKKFRKNKEVWMDFGTFYMKRQKSEAARQLMQRSLNSLEKRDHVDVIGKFAQLEFKYGEPERGKTMFEGIVSSYPKRTDLWSVYIDMLLKHGDADAVRSLFERAITLNLSVKRMKFFFKRYLEFEQQQGDEERVAQVQKKALEYVESKDTLDD